MAMTDEQIVDALARGRPWAVTDQDIIAARRIEAIVRKDCEEKHQVAMTHEEFERFDKITRKDERERCAVIADLVSRGPWLTMGEARERLNWNGLPSDRANIACLNVRDAILRDGEGDDDDEFYPCGHQKSAGGIEQHDCKE